MKTTIGRPVVFLLSLVLTLAVAGSSLAGTDVPLMTTDELKSMLDDPDILILDVRKGKDWKSSEFKIKGAVWKNPKEFTSWSSKFDKDKKYIKKWVPEINTYKYPKPMVEHKAARERCLEVYKKGLNT